MGYYASGTFHIVFPHEQAQQCALAEIAHTRNQNLWEFGYGRPPTSMDEAFSAVWETEGTVSDHPNTYYGYPNEKWCDTYEQFATVVAPYVTHLEGEFRGEDNYAWAWSLKNRKLHESQILDIRQDSLNDMTAAANLTTVLADLITNNATSEGLVRVTKIGMLSLSPTPELIQQLAHDLDPEVAAAAARHIQDALTQN